MIQLFNERRFEKDEAAASAQKMTADNYRGKYAVRWNLKDLFESDEQWFSEYERVNSYIDTFQSFKGTLTDAQGIEKFVKAVSDSEELGTLNRLYVYANLSKALDATNKTANDMLSKMNILTSRWIGQTAFMDEEIGKMDLETRKKVFAEPVLEKYAYSLREYVDEKKVFFSEETNSVLAVKGMIEGRAEHAFQMLAYADNPKKTIIMPDGTEQELTESAYSSIIFGKYDHDFKYEAAEKFYSTPEQYLNTYASLLQTQIIENKTTATLNKYDTYLEYKLSRDDIELEVYENIKKATKALLPAFHKYIEILKEKLGYEHIYYFDVLTGASSYGSEMSYDEIADTAINVLSIMGQDYIDKVKLMLGNGHIDVFPDKNKTTGGFEESSNNGNIMPYILLNFAGELKEGGTLVHELGHAMYAHKSETNSKLNLTSNSPTIFTHEVASTNNEFLMGMYGRDNAKSPDEKLYYIDSMINTINGSVIRQILYSEFEEYLYTIVESGQAIDPDSACDKWMELNREYYGPILEFPESYRCRWAQIPHFYYGFYVFKYATSATYSAATASRIYCGKEGALDSYLEFLSLGNSQKPSKLLKCAGVDPLEQETYDTVVKFYEGMVNEYEKDKNSD